MLSVHQRYRRTDGRTDGRLTIAIPRFALHAASRGNNNNSNNGRLCIAANGWITKFQKYIFYNISTNFNREMKDLVT